jgi:methyl coenzyme M reductase alpha subunit
MALVAQVADTVYDNFPAAIDSIFGTSYAEAAAAAAPAGSTTQAAIGRRLAA